MHICARYKVLAIIDTSI